MKKKTIVFTLAACFVLSISFVWAMWSPEDYTVHVQVVDEEESPIEGVERAIKN
ncbi:MAG: hypothetical protein AAGA18_12715 [Verrucomicrobiota bacterium]